MILPEESRYVLVRIGPDGLTESARTVRSLGEGTRELAKLRLVPSGKWWHLFDLNELRFLDGELEN